MRVLFLRKYNKLLLSIDFGFLGPAPPGKEIRMKKCNRFLKYQLFEE